MSGKIHIELDILPPKSTGQSGKKLGTINGHAILFKTKEARALENMLYGLLYPYRPEKPLDKAITLRLYYWYPYPASWSKKKRESGLLFPKTTKPDYDNSIKQMQDVLTKLQYWTDDARIFDGGLKKFYAPCGKVIINMYEESDNIGFLPDSEMVGKIF